MIESFSSYEMEKSLSLLFNQLGFHFHILLYRNKEKNHVSFHKSEFWTKYKTTDYRFEVCYAPGNASFWSHIYKIGHFWEKIIAMVKLEAIKFEAYKWPQREPCFSPVSGCLIHSTQMSLSLKAEKIVIDIVYVT